MLEASDVQVLRSAVPSKRARSVTTQIVKPKKIRVDPHLPTYIEDTPLAAAALESQLWTSSLANMSQESSKASSLPSSLPLEQQNLASLRPGSSSGKQHEPVNQGDSSREALSGAPSPGVPPTETHAPTSQLRAGEELTEDTNTASNAQNVKYQSDLPSKQGSELAQDDSSTSTLTHFILPPYAPIGLQNPQDISHLTPYLALVASKSPAKKYFYPRAQFTRSLQPQERGYWKITISDPSSKRAWNEKTQTDFWEFMQHAVGEGDAGWGVSCFVEVVQHGQEQQENLSTSQMDPAKRTVYQMYCYGEVVPHVYLMMRLASGGKLRNVLAEWLDGDEKVVVRVPAVPQPQQQP